MYTTLFKKVLYPIYESGIRRRNTLRYLKDLNENQWRSADEIKTRQWRDLKKLLDHAYKNTTYYQSLFKRLGLHPDQIQSYEDFQTIPVCTREEVNQHVQEMVADNYRNRVAYKSTGGSTGVPLRLAYDRASYEWRIAATQRGYQWAKCEAGQFVLYLWALDIGKPPLLKRVKTALYHRLFNRVIVNSWDLDEAAMRNCLEYINSKKPQGIVAYTSAIYNLAKFIDAKNLQCNGVPAILTGAEHLHEHQRELIERVFHTKVYNSYGCREFMLIATECEKHEGLHVTADNLFVEILKDGRPAKPGETGEVVITDLHNYGMPFIRYKNGDRAIQSGKLCSCGRGLPLIEGIDGRIADMIIAHDGTEVPGIYFPHLMKEFPQVRKYQVIQKSRELLQVKLVLAEKMSDERLQFCKNQINGVLGKEVKIDFEFVDEIPLTHSGKYRVAISEISAQ